MEYNEREIQEKIEQILSANGDYEKIHEHQKLKRLKWYEENKNRLNLSGSLVRQAFEMVLFRYMGINPEEVPVVEETETTITWRSFNFCSILEACKRLNLDTRVVCREAYQQSVQDIISEIDPRLRFSRNYETGIRPYSTYCEETIKLIE